MATKDITDIQVLLAYKESKRAVYRDKDKWPYDFLVETTGQPIKVCYRAMERASLRDLIDWGTTLRSGWVTEKGERLLAESNPKKEGL